jgi:Bacterial protein of unknown function (DUF922)
MRIILGFILCISFMQAAAQKIIISGKEGNRPLVWEDFKGKPDNSIPYFAMTNWAVSYGFSNVQFKGDEVVIGNFDVKLELMPKGSWLKAGKGTAALLEHEQGHFNTGLLCLKTFLKREKELLPTLTRKNFGEQIQLLFNEVLKKYTLMGEKYDEETDHSKNIEQQAKWNSFFKEQLAL